MVLSFVIKSSLFALVAQESDKTIYCIDSISLVHNRFIFICSWVVTMVSAVI